MLPVMVVPAAWVEVVARVAKAFIAPMVPPKIICPDPAVTVKDLAVPPPDNVKLLASFARALPYGKLYKVALAPAELSKTWDQPPKPPC